MRVRAQWVVPLFLLLLALPLLGHPDDFTYTTNNGAITITEYIGPGGDVTIPDTINGMPIVAIGDQAFLSCPTLTSVTTLDNLASIGGAAFRLCTALTNVTIGNRVTNIGNVAFKTCTTLPVITISSNVTSIGLEAFSECSSLAAITVHPNNPAYSSLDGVLFDKNQILLIQCPAGKAGMYAIPNSVTTVGDSSFQGCAGLTNITIPNSLTNIEAYAFIACSFSTVIIPSNVISIGQSALDYCPELGTITVAPLNPSYASVDGVLFNKSQTTLIQYPIAKIGTSYSIPNTITTIGGDAFSHCANLTSITMPASVTNIGRSAFSFYASLQGLYFQGNAPSLRESVFFGPDDHPVVYYLPGTIGWGPTFGDPPSWARPTALWRPLIQTTDGAFGVHTNHFAFNIAWASGMNIALDACTSLVNPTWLPMQTNTLTADTIYFSDPDWANSPRRFYRVRWPGPTVP